MTIFDLLFIVVFLASVSVLLAAFVQILRRRARQALKMLSVFGLCLAAYVGVVVTVSLASPQRLVAAGQDRCFDDWCVAVDSAATFDTLGQGELAINANGVFYVVTLRLSNHGRGRPQRASSAAVTLRDDDGRPYDVSTRGQRAFEAEHGPAAPLTTTVSVGQPVVTVQVFDVPSSAHISGLTIQHPVGSGPGLFIIGDESSLFHKPTLSLLR
jgi:hypothetical protein